MSEPSLTTIHALTLRIDRLEDNQIHEPGDCPSKGICDLCRMRRRDDAMKLLLPQMIRAHADMDRETMRIFLTSAAAFYTFA